MDIKERTGAKCPPTTARFSNVTILPLSLLYLSGKGLLFSLELAYFLTSVIMVVRRVSSVKVAAVQSCQSVEENTGE